MRGRRSVTWAFDPAEGWSPRHVRRRVPITTNHGEERDDPRLARARGTERRRWLRATRVGPPSEPEPTAWPRSRSTDGRGRAWLGAHQARGRGTLSLIGGVRGVVNDSATAYRGDRARVPATPGSRARSTSRRRCAPGTRGRRATCRSTRRSTAGRSDASRRRPDRARGPGAALVPPSRPGDRRRHRHAPRPRDRRRRLELRQPCWCSARTWHAVRADDGRRTGGAAGADPTLHARLSSVATSRRAERDGG